MTDKKEILNDFLKWVKDPTQKKFSHYKPFGDRILMRLYLFTPKEEKIKIYKDFNSDKSITQELRSRLFPIGKILAIGNGVRKVYKEGLSPGDLVTVSDLMTGSKLNDEWEKYQMMALEKPGMREKVIEPPRYIGWISQWKEYVFVQDKFVDKPNIEDAYTFLLPERYILAKYEKN